MTERPVLYIGKQVYFSFLINLIDFLRKYILGSNWVLETYKIVIDVDTTAKITNIPFWKKKKKPPNFEQLCSFYVSFSKCFENIIQWFYFHTVPLRELSSALMPLSTAHRLGSEFHCPCKPHSSRRSTDNF